MGGGAAHSNTQKRKVKSGDKFLDCRENTEGKGNRKETGETEDVTWGPRDSQVCFKKQKIRRIVHKGAGM